MKPLMSQALTNPVSPSLQVVLRVSDICNPSQSPIQKSFTNGELFNGTADFRLQIKNSRFQTAACSCERSSLYVEKGVFLCPNQKEKPVGLHIHDSVGNDRDLFHMHCMRLSHDDSCFRCTVQCFILDH